MNWQALTWEPLDGPLLAAAQGLAEFGEYLRGAIEESASALIQAPISLGDARATRLEAMSDAPGDFEPVATFELMAAARRQVVVGLDPAAGSSLAGAGVVPVILARAIIEGIDAVFADTLGEGVNIGPADAARIPADAPIIVLRLPLRGPDGGGVDLLALVEEPVPAEVGAHIVALKALGTLDVPAPVAPVSAGHAPVHPDGMQAAADAAFAAMAAQGPAAQQPGPASAQGPARMAPAPAPAPVPAANIRPASFDELQPRPPERSTTSLDLLLGVNLQVTVEIGRTRLPIREILGLAPGSIVELDKLAGEPVDVLVNGRQIATGEVVVVDENFGVRITEIVSRQRRIAAGAAA